MRTIQLAVIAGALLLSACGTSAEHKAKIRLAVSAMERAAQASGPAENALADLQRAVDAVPDGDARTKIVDCQRMLAHYKRVTQMQSLATRANLIEMGYPRSETKAGFDAAYDSARIKHPLPDYDPIAACLVQLVVLAP